MSDKRDSTKCPNPHRISVTNLLKEETLTFSLALLKGEIILSSNDASSFCNNYLTLYNLTKKTATNWPILKSKFKCLVDLERGENRIILKYCTTCKRIALNYTPRDTDHVVTPLYIICRNHSGEFQAPSECDNSIDSACSRVVLGSKLIQCLIAEKLFENGFGRKTFQIEADVIDEIPYCIQFHSNLPVEEARQMDQEALWIYFGREIMKSNFSSTKRKFLAFLSATWWDSGAVKAHAALGGGGLALFGTGCLHTWPTRVEDVFTCFLDPTLVDTSRIMDDSCFRGTYGGCFSTTLGSVCHELGHTFDLGHSRDGIMGRGFDNIDMVFLPHSHCHKDSIQFATVQLISRLKVECFVTSLSRFNSPLRQPNSRNNSNSSPASDKTNGTCLNSSPNYTKINDSSSISLVSGDGSQNSITTIDSNVKDHSNSICERPNSSPLRQPSRNSKNSSLHTTKSGGSSLTCNTSQNFNYFSNNNYTSSNKDSNFTSNNENHFNTVSNSDSMSTVSDIKLGNIDDYNNSNISSSSDSNSTSKSGNNTGNNESNSDDTSDCVNNSKTGSNFSNSTSIKGNHSNITSNTSNYSNTSSRGGNSKKTACNINYNANCCNLLNTTSDINSNTSSNNSNTMINKCNNSSPRRQPTNINSNTSSNRSNNSNPTSRTSYPNNNSANSAPSSTSDKSNTSAVDNSNITSNNLKSSSNNSSSTSKTGYLNNSSNSSPSNTNNHSNTSNKLKTSSNNSNYTSNCCNPSNPAQSDSPRRSTNSPSRLVANSSPSKLSTNRNKRNNNVLVVQQQIKNKDSDSMANGVDDRTYWTPSCATLLAYHKWFNCAQSNRDELKYNAVRGLVTSSAGLRVVELRGEESIVLHSWQFTGSRPKTQLVVPKQISARAQLIVIEDNNGNIVKQDLTTTSSTTVANNFNNNV